MPSVSDFIQDKATLRFGDPDRETVIVYRPSALDADRTEDFFDRLKENDVLAAATLLTGYAPEDALILEWNLEGPLTGRRDLRDADGEPIRDARGRPRRETYEAVAAGETIPLDPAVLRFLPPTVLIGIYGEIQDDAARLVGDGFFGRTRTPSSNGSRPR